MTKERVNQIQAQARAKTSLLTAMRASPVFKDYVSMLEVTLELERENFETREADEFTRGRIGMLKDLIKEIK